MKTYFGTISLALTCLFMVACAHHKDVRPSANGVHRVTVQSENGASGSRNALKQANHFCEQRNRSAAIVDEKQSYTGDVDESTYRTGKKATKVAQVLGGAGTVFGGKKEKNIGGVALLGGAVGDAALGKGYTVEMKFKCM